MKLLVFVILIAPACRSISDWRPVLQPDLYPGLKGRFPSEPSFPSLPSLVAQSYQQPSPPHAGGQCELYKVGFLQDLYFQYIQYKVSLPELKEFTLCYWSKFSNHSNDHPIFSYAVDGQPRSILAWVSNTDRSSYFSMAIEGHTFYRLNYPLRLNRWYHTCQSWNGRTGEWQIWVNAERVGRGFHNRLVGHRIPSGGIAITGQEQTQYGGGFLEGDLAPKGAGGMLGEVTMIQLYRVALTAGKAHRDHKHHHAHTFDHNGVPITTTPPPPRPPRPLTPTHPLLTGGQLNPNIALTIASGQTQQLTPQFLPGQSFDTQLLGGQFFGNLVPQQMMNAPQSRGPQQFIPQDTQPGQLPQPRQPLGQRQQQQQLQFLSPASQQLLQSSQLGGSAQFLQSSQLGGSAQLLQNSQLGGNAQQLLQNSQLGGNAQQLLQNAQLGASSLLNSGLVHSSLINPTNIQILEPQLETHQLFKREDNKNETKQEDSNKDDKKKSAAPPKEKEAVKLDSKSKPSIDPVAASKDSAEKKYSKRELFLEGDTLIDDGALSGSFDQTLLNGLAGIGQNEPVLQMQKQYDEREPAEAEVMAVMNLCSGCDEEPFGKALVFGWRGVPKKLYSGAFYTPAVPQCKAF